VEKNDAIVTNRSQSADSRPAKIHKGFGVGDVVYVAPEFWYLQGKHPRGYDRTTRFVIVKQSLREGFWDLCAKKDMRTQPRHIFNEYLPKNASDWDRTQLQIHSLYLDGFLGDVPARLLCARPLSLLRTSEPTVWIDLTKK